MSAARLRCCGYCMAGAQRPIWIRRSVDCRPAKVRQSVACLSAPSAPPWAYAEPNPSGRDESPWMVLEWAALAGQLLQGLVGGQHQYIETSVRPRPPPPPSSFTAALRSLSCPLSRPLLPCTPAAPARIGPASPAPSPLRPVCTPTPKSPLHGQRRHRPARAMDEPRPESR